MPLRLIAYAPPPSTPAPAIAPAAIAQGTQPGSLESRPVSVIGAVDVGRQIGVEAIQWLAIFNIFVGVFNLLPLLPLDGGHLAIATYERIRSRRGERYVVDVNKLLPITYAVFLLMVLFGLGAIWLDIANPIRL